MFCHGSSGLRGGLYWRMRSRESEGGQGHSEEYTDGGDGESSDAGLDLRFVDDFHVVSQRTLNRMCWGTFFIPKMQLQNNAHPGRTA